MVGFRVLRHVRFERDARAFEKDDLARPVVLRGVAVVRVVQSAEIGGDADRVAPGGDVLEHAGIPDAFLALAVGPVVVKVAELPDQRALPDARSADDGYAHVLSEFPAPPGARPGQDGRSDAVLYPAYRIAAGEA